MASYDGLCLFRRTARCKATVRFPYQPREIEQKLYISTQFRKTGLKKERVGLREFPEPHPNATIGLTCPGCEPAMGSPQALFALYSLKTILSIQLIFRLI